MNEKRTSILIGGLVVTVLSTSYLGFINLVCCLGVVIGALVTVWHYTSTHSLTVTAGEGAGMGIRAGLIGVVAASLLNFAFAQAGLDATTFANQFMLDRFGDGMPPEQVDELERQIREGPSVQDLLMGLGIGALLYSLFGAAGGAIGAALFKKGEDDHV